MSTRTTQRTLAAVLALVMSACGSAAPDEVETTAARDVRTGSVDRSGSGPTSGGEDLSARCDVSPVYFAYDSSDLDSRARSSLEASARCLQQRGATARVTGMTDPRGTEEYNLALGDRRARSVKQYLTNLGVDPSRLDVRSVGEEHAAGEDEHGWAQDRRAEIEMR